MENNNGSRKTGYRIYTETYNWEFKNEFLEKAKEQIEMNAFNQYRFNSLRNLMRKVGRWENRYQKDLYDFSTEELKGMLREFNSKSKMSLMAQKSNIEFYLVYSKAIGASKTNNTPSGIELSSSDIEDMINPIGAEQMLISREDIYDLVRPEFDGGDLVSGLINPSDRASILLIFEGIMGKDYEDIINIKWRDFNYKEKTLLIRDKKIKLDSNTSKVLDDIELTLNNELADTIDKVIDEDHYYFLNGKYKNEGAEKYGDKKKKNDGITIRKRYSMMLSKYDSEYLFRPLAEKSSEDNTKMTMIQMQSRILNNFKKQLDSPHLTSKSIYISGLIDRGIKYSEDILGKKMRHIEWKKWLEENNEKVNIQTTYDMYSDMYDKYSNN